jgi:tetraacyldisaccharide 4'-kinase
LQFTRRILKYRSGYRDLFFYPLCWILGGVNSLYTFWGEVRHSLYNKGILKSKRLKAKVISVGNIVAGGTGKTPLVTYLAEGLIKRGHKVAVLTRGYRRIPKDQVIFKGEDSDLKWQEVGDEPFLLAKRFPELIIGVSRDRYRCGEEIISRFDPDVFILDDGFQHHQLNRDLNLVVLDSAFPFGKRPQLKRERKASLRFADIIVLNDTLGLKSIEPTIKELKKSNPHATVSVFGYRFSGIRNLEDKKPIPMEKARNSDLVAVSGIGNPLSFGTTLSRLELNAKEHVVFEDHHRFDLKDYRNLVNRARQLGATALITTEKDAVKFSSFDKSEMPVYYVTVEVEFLQGELFLWEAIEKVMKDGDRE